MKLLVLTPYCAPEQAASSYLAQNRTEAFIANRIDTIVYTPTPCRGLDKETIKEYKKNKYKCQRLYDGHRVIHRFNMYNEGKNSLSRALRYFLIALQHLLKGIYAKDAKSCDVLFLASTPPFQGALGGIIKKWRKIPFVYNLQDIFPDSLVNNGLAKKGGMLWKIGRVIENFTYKHADKIIVISQDFKKNIMAKGVPEEKIEVVYNWVDEKAVVDVPREENKLFDKYNLPRDKFYITYSGNIGLSQNMDMLLEVADELRDNQKIHFVLIGDGAYKKEVEEIVKNKDLKNVSLIPFQPYEDISHVFSLGNAGLVISKPGTGAASVPSKTWSIMSASRPVLANFDENELKDIISDNKCGIFTKAGDKEVFKESILYLYNHPDECVEYGKNARNFIMQNLTREIGTTKLVNIIKQFEKNNHTI